MCPECVMRVTLLAAVLVTGSRVERRQAPKSKSDDALASELVDQADPEFDAMSGGDDCIDMDDMEKFVDSQLGPAPQCDPGVPEGHCQAELEEYNDMKADMHDYAKTMHAYADRCVTGKEDDCVDRKEFVKVNEMEGPPPGFEESAAEGMTEGELEEASSAPGCELFDANEDGVISKSEVKAKAKELGEDDMSANFMADVYTEFMDKDGNPGVSCEEYDNGIKALESPEGQDQLAEVMEKQMLKQEEAVKEVECDMMDLDGDGKLSRSEVFTYVSELEGADLTSDTLDEIITAADKDQDGFISHQECVQAGKEYDGDGVENNEKDQVGHAGNEADNDALTFSQKSAGLRKSQRKPHNRRTKDSSQRMHGSPSLISATRRQKVVQNLPTKRHVNLWRLIADVKKSPKLHWRPDFRWIVFRVPSLKKFAGFVKRRGAKLAHRWHLTSQTKGPSAHHQKSRS